MKNKPVETMTQQEIFNWLVDDRASLFEALRAFLQTGKTITRSIVFGMLYFHQTDFTYLTLKNLDLSDLDLQWVNFEGATIEDCNFCSSDLSNATFRNCRVKNCNFDDALFINTFMLSGKFENCNFRGVSLIYAQELPKGIKNKNYEVNADAPDSERSVCVGYESDSDNDLAVRCLSILLDRFTRQGIDCREPLLLAQMVYSELKIRVNGEVNKQGFMAFFDRYYPCWLKKISKLESLPTVESLEEAGFSFWAN